MSGDEKHEGNIEGTINAVTGLMKAVPVYDDALKPIAIEAGKALGTVGKVVNTALIPIRGMIWGIEKIEVFIQTKVAQKLEKIPVENIITPDLAIAGPALESLRYTGHKESLAELYANLLATSMDSETANTAHPGFVEIIRNLSSDEAKLLTFIVSVPAVPLVDIRRLEDKTHSGRVVNQLISTAASDAGCEHRNLSGTYFTNLERLGLIEIDKGIFLSDESRYARILNDEPVQNLINNINQEVGYFAQITKYFAIPTPLGRQFSAACVISKNQD